MFHDMVKMMTFIVEQTYIEENPSTVNDIYIQLYKLHKSMNLIISSLSRDIENYYIKTLDKTPKSQWILVLNEQLNIYENLKYGMSSIVSKLGDNYINNNVILSLNHSKIIADISCNEKRLSMIKSAQKDKDQIAKLLIKLEGLLQEKFGIIDLFKKRKKLLLNNW